MNILNVRFLSLPLLNCVCLFDARGNFGVTCKLGSQPHNLLTHHSVACVGLGPISQRDLSPDLDLNLRLWS